MALGAPSTGIAWMVLCESLVLVAAGVTAGVGTVLLAGRLVASRRLPISRPDAPRASTPDRAPGRVSPRTSRSSSLSRADLFQHAGRLGCIQKRRTSQSRRVTSDVSRAAEGRLPAANVRRFRNRLHGLRDHWRAGSASRAKGGIANQAGAGDVGVGDRHDSVRNKGSFPPYYQPNDLDARNPVGETLKATVSDPTCAHLVASNVPSVISGTPIKRPIMNS